MGISDVWYRNAVVYAVDVGTYLDSDGDGIGDFRGLTARLGYLERLGVDCLWLLPFFPSPGRDNGYDVMDFYGVDPKLGTPGDFVEFLHEARGRGMHVILDLVVNHTSDQHPWFQSAQSSPDSPFRDFYVWTDRPPPQDERARPVFPSRTESVWTWSERAGAYYFHRFYDFEPGLNLRNPAVREEIRRIMGFWLELGVSGFRVDAAPFLVWPKGPVPGDPDHSTLRRMHRFSRQRRADAVLLAEANVEPDALGSFFGDGDEMQLLFDFLGCSHLFLALARGRAAPIADGLELLPEKPEDAQWIRFLRNLDELDLERLSKAERQEVFDAFAPDERMRFAGRGIRRRLAPLLGGDLRRIELAFSLTLTLPGTPLLVYGDEIGMGDDLSLEGRNAVRTPMQWSEEPNAGFSEAPTEQLVRPVIDEGDFGYRRVNVAAAREDPDSLLNWLERIVRTRRECPEFGLGGWQVLDTGDDALFAHRCEWAGGVMIAVHNLSTAPRTARLDIPDDAKLGLLEVAADAHYDPPEGSPLAVEIGGYGYRWFRVGGVRRSRGVW